MGQDAQSVWCPPGDLIPRPALMIGAFLVLEGVISNPKTADPANQARRLIIEWTAQL